LTELREKKGKKPTSINEFCDSFQWNRLTSNKNSCHPRQPFVNLNITFKEIAFSTERIC